MPLPQSFNQPPLIIPEKKAVGPDTKPSNIRTIQAMSLTTRKKPITLWHPNIPNYGDKDHD